MEDLEKTKHITLRLEESLIGIIEQLPDLKSRTDFIRKAIKNELKLQTKEAREIAQINRVLEQLNAKNIENKVNDTSIKMQLIFNEIKKQTEILKLVHRRSSHSANYALKIINEVSNSPAAVEACFNETNQVIAGEIKELEI